MLEEELVYQTGAQLVALMRKREVSPVEIVQVFLDRIARLDQQLNTYLHVAHDLAMERARAAERILLSNEESPLLTGLPVAIKDLTHVSKMPCTGGSLLFKDWQPDANAVVVERLLEAGCVVLGKTNTPEFGGSATTENLLGDDCRNPWDRSRTSGGSSGGSAAAIAAGLASIALGSDGGGSIRIPAAFCGIFGFKPTYGTIPRHGGFSGMPKFSHLGPITRDVSDAAMFLNVTAGYDVRDPSSLRTRTSDFGSGIGQDLAGLRVAWSTDLNYALVDPEVIETTYHTALIFRSLGCIFAEEDPGIQQPFTAFGTIVNADSYEAFGSYLGKAHSLMMVDTVRGLERGARVTDEEYRNAIKDINRCRELLAKFFERYDLLVTPTTAVPAFPLGERPSAIGGGDSSTLWGPFPFTVPFNISGQPAATIPCGFSRDGLPIGLQVVGRFGDDATVLRACAALESAQPWNHQRPRV